MVNYYIITASRDHVLKGVAGGFAQACHGKVAPLRRMHAGDRVIYYSPKNIFEPKCSTDSCGTSTGAAAKTAAALSAKENKCQRFTALGTVAQDDTPYSFDMGNGFVPYRINVNFDSSIAEVDAADVVQKLSFIKNKTSWGMAFRYGHVQVPQADFELIESKMLRK